MVTRKRIVYIMFDKLIDMWQHRKRLIMGMKLTGHFPEDFSKNKSEQRLNDHHSGFVGSTKPIGVTISFRENCTFRHKMDTF